MPLALVMALYKPCFAELGELSDQFYMGLEKYHCDYSWISVKGENINRKSLEKHNIVIENSYKIYDRIVI
jgi:hypothetical protein